MIEKNELTINFGLIAVRRADGVLFVREYFEGPKLGTIPGRPALQMKGYVDEDIRINNPKQYAPFKAYVEAHAEELYPRAKAAFPEPIFDLIPELIEEEKAEAPKKKKRTKEEGE